MEMQHNFQTLKFKELLKIYVAENGIIKLEERYEI